MAALSRSSILARLKLADNLVISPILADSQLGDSSIDLRMGTVALVARAGGQPTVDPAIQLRTNNDAHASTERREQKHERFDVPFGHSFLLHPGSLLLVPTLEWVKIP